MSDTKTHVIDGKTYVEVERKAKIGETIIDLEDGEILTITGIRSDGKRLYRSRIPINEHEYRVLEPLDTVDTTQASPSVVDMLANLARRVSSLEEQLRDTQGNTETLAEELAEISHITEANGQDIAMLDERTQPQKGEAKTNEPLVFDLAKMKSFKLSDLNGKTLTVYSATDTADGVTVTTTVAIEKISGKMYVLESEVVAR